MAVEHYCDYCGQLIEGEWATIESGTHPSPLWTKAAYFHFCAGTREDHAEACFELARKGLHEMKRWAHRGEGSPLQWTLTERRTPTAPTEGDADRPEMPEHETAEIEARIKEYTQRFRESDLPVEPELRHAARRALVGAGLWKMEHVAACDEARLSRVSGIGPKALAQIKAALEQRGMALGSKVA